METLGMDPEVLTMLRDSLERYGREKYRFEARASMLAQAHGFERSIWGEYAEMGWLALPCGAESGGFDNAREAIVALMEYSGAHLALEPLFSAVVMCGGILSRLPDDPVAQHCLRALSAGESIFALAHGEDVAEATSAGLMTCVSGGRLSGEKRVVLSGDVADRLIVTATAEDGGAVALYLVDAARPEVRRTSYRLVDGRGAASFDFVHVPVERLGVAAHTPAVLESALRDARLALSAEAHGAVQAVNRMTLAYLKERRQFGRPIGANQALQHRMVELHMQQEELGAVIKAAIREPSDGYSRAVSAALAHAIAVGRHASHEAVQLHGGIGITEELPVSHFFRRLMVTGRLLGDRDQHLARFALETTRVRLPTT